MKNLLLAATATTLMLAAYPAKADDSRIFWRFTPTVLEFATTPENPGEEPGEGEAGGGDDGDEEAPGEITSVSLPYHSLPDGFVDEPWAFDFREIVEVEGGDAEDLSWSFGTPALDWMGFAEPGLAAGMPSTPGLFSFRLAAEGGEHEANQRYSVFIDGHELVAVDIAAGDAHNCAATPDGKAVCWGDNSAGQLGNGTTAGSNVPVEVQGISGNVVQVAAGGSHSCATTAEGTAFCWGQGTVGQLGHGQRTNHTTAVEVSGLSGVTDVTAGATHSCALSSNGVSCWGNASYGRVGNGVTSGTFPSPVTISSLEASAVTSISGNSHTTCARLSDGTAKCWGMGSSGRLGRGSTANASSPVHVVGSDGQPITSVVSVNPGFAHGCLLRESGEVMCWGKQGAHLGKTGTPSATNYAMLADALPVDVVKLSVGGYHGCYVTSGGSFSCFGANGKGQLGAGNISGTSPQANPLAAPSIIVAGQYHTCAIATAGNAFCWGDNGDGQAGAGVFSTRFETPVAVKAR